MPRRRSNKRRGLRTIGFTSLPAAVLPRKSRRLAKLSIYFSWRPTNALAASCFGAIPCWANQITQRNEWPKWRSQALQLLPLQLRDDTSEFQHPMKPREPQRPLPTQAAFWADASQLHAIVSAAVPHAAAHRAGQCVFGHEQQHLGLWPHHASQLAQARPGIRKMFEDPSANDSVEITIGKGQTRQVGRGER